MADASGETIIFLERDKFYLYNGGSVLSLNFPAQILPDLDVKNKDALFNLITTFIQNNKIEPSQLFFVISEAVCFSKDFPVKDPTDVTGVQTSSQAFIDAVPFNSVLSKIYKTQTVYRVVATNQELVDVVVDAFVHRGFGLTAIVPANIYPEFGALRELTDKFAKHIIDTREKAKLSSMVGEKIAPESHELATSVTKEPKSKLLPYLIGGFVILLVILVIVVVLRR
ncbi:MAG: hypothetical protein HYV90_00215 [Candidatus Woesebacteria bacterium]|nr:MAG: hypothetical protein HYV90_00215 [Candidatus Woesebacteria bacterium]